MTKPRGEHIVSNDRRKADRLRTIRERLRSFGKKGLVDLFAAGEALEEAATLHDGSFSVWVKSECGIEPRTALGYRKTFRVLGRQKDWLAKRNVSPSVAVTIACASVEARERALATIASGRSLSVAQAKAIILEVSSCKRGSPSSADALRRAARDLAKSFVKEVDRIAELAATANPTDEASLRELRERAVAALPAISALADSPTGASIREARSMVHAIGDLAVSADMSMIHEGARGLTAALSKAATVEDGRSAAPRELSKPEAIRRSLSSSFDHGLTAFEICAGGGGQAAGLAKAGFRHVALVERDPSACETLRAAFGPDHVIEADLVGFEPGEVGTVDLLAGGVPCQPYSQSGRRRGAKDERDLFPEALRLVEAIRPRAVMLENVMGVFAPDNDMNRFRILARLRKLGYVAEWGSVDATHFGVPQKRLRAVLVAFREPEAMVRFSWPKAAFDYAEAAGTVISALMGHFTSREWQPSEAFVTAMDRTAPTVTGGSDRKQGIDFGQRKSALVWGEMGFVQTRIGNVPPAADHQGFVEATNAMLATLQAFPFDWPFRGSKKSVFRQVANAFPTPVAMHLGCAIASALTGRSFDPIDQHVHEAMRWNHVRRPPSPAAVARQQQALPVSTMPQRIRLPLASLRKGTGTIEDPNGRSAEL